MEESFNSVPDDVLQHQIVGWLNPKEIAKLASCNSHLRSALPNPLRIQIMNDNEVLEHTLFVCEFPSGRILTNGESLRFGRRYRFWNFDYERGHRCDLISHLPLEKGTGFDLAFAAWQRTKHDRCNRRTWIVGCGNKSNNSYQEGDIVPWGTDVQLMVEGGTEFPAFDCHAKRRYLANYRIVEDPEDEVEDEEEIAEEIGWAVFDTPGEEKFKIIRKDDKTKEQNNVPPKEEIRLKTRATAVFQGDDGAFAFYSQRSLEAGGLDFGREQVVVFFELWTKKGMLHIKTDQLPFECVVPMMRLSANTPEYKSLSKEHPLLETLWNIHEDHMIPVFSFLATAANCLLWDGEYPVDTLETFARTETEVGYCDNKAQQFILNEDVSIKGKGLPLQRPEYANMPREDERNKFFCIFTRPCF